MDIRLSLWASVHAHVETTVALEKHLAASRLLHLAHPASALLTRTHDLIACSLMHLHVSQLKCNSCQQNQHHRGLQRGRKPSCGGEGCGGHRQEQ